MKYGRSEYKPLRGLGQRVVTKGCKKGGICMGGKKDVESGTKGYTLPPISS